MFLGDFSASKSSCKETVTMDRRTVTEMVQNTPSGRDHFAALGGGIRSQILVELTRGQSKLTKVASNLLTLAVGDQDPRLTECSLGPQQCSAQTGS